ncbi:MAG TPA: hypothetical protein DHW42_08685 [Candidatus Marinimicrobia bacterium]|nr:hypothetical protein [Candidatus Neomarinimicrobiota bacterium]
MKNNLLQEKIFKNTMRILNKHNIPFWLDSGTLLGIIRNDEGIAWHRNIDIAIPAEFYNKFIATKKEFLPKYRFREMLDGSGRTWIDGNVARIKIMKYFDKVRTAKLLINVTFKFKKEDEYRWVDTRSCKWVDSHFFDKLDNITIQGIDYPVPSDVENYLTKRYGEWKNPEKYWISTIHDLSIVDQKTIRDIPKKKVIQKHNKKTIQLTGKYRKQMKKMILNVIDILEKNNIPYWLDEGTLLGIIREGDLLPWDHDADFGIPGEYAQKVIDLRYKFFPKYFVKINKTKSVWLPGNIRSIKLKTPFERLIRINFHIDLFFKYKVDDSCRWIIMTALKHSDSKFFDKLDTVNWEGRKVNIPSHVEEYLELNYGDWRTPDPDFDPSIDNGTIAEKGF